MIVTDIKPDPAQAPSTEALPPPAYPQSHEHGLDHASAEAPGPPHWQPVSTGYPATPYPPTFSRQGSQHAPPTGSPYPPGQGEQHRPAPAGRAPPPITPAQEEALIGQQYQQQLLAQCARGQHAPRTVYGVWGIVLAIFLFPIGLIFLFLDKETWCSRCGMRIDSASNSLA